MGKLSYFTQEFKILKPFITIWFGQLVSLIGSSLTSFALDLWIYQKTGSVTQYALVSLCMTMPPILLSPFAGTFADRWDRRWIMFFSDLGAGMVTLSIAFLFFFNQLNFWFICIAIGVISSFGVFQRLAATTATRLLVPKKHLGRAIGMMQIGESAASIFVPALAGILVLTIQLQGVLLIDCVTYFFSLGTLILIKFPKNLLRDDGIDILEESESSEQEKYESSSIITELTYAWQYITSRPSFAGLILYFMVTNFLIGMVSLLIMPMLLNFVSSATAGTILSIGGFGTLLGSIVMGVWGGPKQRMPGILGLSLLLGSCIMVAGLRPSVPLITAAVFGGLFCFPLISALNEALLLTKVSREVQGRVFGLLTTMSSAAIPLSYLLAGPLVDRVFEPLMAVNGALADSVGMLIGTGSGRGIGLLFVVLGLSQIVASVIAYSYRPLRNIDRAVS